MYPISLPTLHYSITTTPQFLWFPAALIQLPIRFQSETKVERPRRRQRLFGIEHLTDHGQIIFLRVFVDRAVGRERTYQIVVQAGHRRGG